MLLNDENSCPLAMMPEEASEIISSLQSIVSVELEMYCKVQEITKNKSPKKANPSTVRRALSLQIIVQGPHGKANCVGDYLQECNIYLQDPVIGNGLAKYANPHRLFQAGEGELEDDKRDRKRTAEHSLVVNSSINPFSALENGHDLPLAEDPPGLATSLFRCLPRCVLFALCLK